MKSQAFNEYTFYNIKSHGTYVRTYNKFYATDIGFTDKNVESIKNVVKEEIESRSFFAKAYIIITSGAKSYKIGYESFMDSNTYAGTSMDFNITTIVDFTNNTIKCAEDYKENAYKYYEDENLTLLNPNYFNPLITTKIGLVLDIIMLLIYILYIIVIKKILKVEKI